MSQSNSKNRPPKVFRVGLVHGGPTHLPDGAWGCDIECVENEKACFQGDSRFSCIDVFIRDLASEQSSTILEGLDVLVIPGGNDEYDDLYGGPGQREALGEAGLKAIEEAIETRGLLYVGICAGAFLAANKGCGKKIVLAPSIWLHDEQNFGWASVRGCVRLYVPPSKYKEILGPWWKRNVYYDDGPAMIVRSEVDGKSTEILATYKSKVQIELSDRQRVERRYFSVATELAGKAAVTLTKRGKGKVLLIGPHAECCGRSVRNTLVNLIAAIRTQNEQ